MQKLLEPREGCEESGELPAGRVSLLNRVEPLSIKFCHWLCTRSPQELPSGRATGHQVSPLGIKFCQDWVSGYRNQKSNLVSMGPKRGGG